MNILRKLRKNNAFTLVEVLVSMTLFAVIIVAAFWVFWKISTGKVKVTNKLDAWKDLYYSIEKFFYLIKSWWDIDYEEYWNRKLMGTQTSSWYYSKFTWFGNFWSWWDLNSNSNFWTWFYYCRSNDGGIISSTWCVGNYNNFWASFSWILQRYWEYTFQFVDYNSNADDEQSRCTSLWKPWGWEWDQDCDWKIVWDDDDENLWTWPEAFSGNEVKELYLTKSWKNPTRNFFRMIYRKDPTAPNWIICDPNGTHTFSWCIWNVQMLKLDWMDLGLSHDWVYDWKIDTWCCDKDYKCSWILANCTIPRENDMKDNWTRVDIFPDYFNVKDIKFFVYPNKNFKLAWKEDSDNLAINSYVRIKIVVGYSWKQLKRMWKDYQITLYTTLNLNK